MWIHLLPLELIDGAGGGAQEPVARGGHFPPMDDRKRRRKERDTEEDRRRVIAALFRRADELPAIEQQELAAIQERFADPDTQNDAGVDYGALLAQLAVVDRLLDIYRDYLSREADERDDEDALMVMM